MQLKTCNSNKTLLIFSHCKKSHNRRPPLFDAEPFLSGHQLNDATGPPNVRVVDIHDIDSEKNCFLLKLLLQAS